MNPPTIYRWKTAVSTVKFGKRASKELLYQWFRSLPLARQQRILKEIAQRL